MSPLTYWPDSDITDDAIAVADDGANAKAPTPCIPDTAAAPVIEWMNRRRAPLSLRLFRGAALLAVVAMAITLVLR